jgi:HD-GYP domain-containing protein (c-di-GMP phosphodiesterase class II)
MQVISLGLKGPAAATDLIKTRCERGADIARSLGFPELTAQAILDLDEHWNGHGDPKGLKGTQISLLGRILDIAQTIDVFFIEQGAEAAKHVVRKRRGSWFDPALADLFLKQIATEKDFWQRLKSPDLINQIHAYEPEDRVLLADDDRLDEIADAFARVIDAKSPYTVKHSTRVKQILLGMAHELRLPASERRDLSRAALLHDMGKLGVSNKILDKKGKLTDAEWEVIRKHTEYTYLILRRVNGFGYLAEIASAHHERLDGKGYHRNLRQGELPTAALLLAVADQYEAMTSTRPYRQALPSAEVLQILEAQVGTGVDAQAFEALRDLVAKGQVSPFDSTTD